MQHNNRITANAGRLAGLLLCTLFAGCNSSSSSVPAMPAEPTVAERLQAALDQAVFDGLPGAALAVRSDDFSFDGVAGVEELATAVPLTVRHRFYLASVGKTYTAVAIVRLAADGLLNLDDPITRWLPAGITDRIPFGDAIRIRHLLNHTSGIFDYQDDADEWLLDAFLPDPARHWSNADVLPYFLDRPSHFAPGTNAGYSDSNYVLAGMIAEAASGLPIQSIVRNYLIAPLGLQDTVQGYEAQGLPDFVHGYVEWDGDLLDVFPWYSHYGVTDGGVQASVSDLATFLREVLTGDTVLDDAMRAELLTASGLGNPPSVAGLGIDIVPGTTAGSAVYSSQGQDAGSRAEVFHFTSAESDLTIALAASASLGSYDILYERFHDAVVEILSNAELIPGGEA